MKKKIKDRKKINIDSIYAVAGTTFGVTCYRGFAPLATLSQLSTADEYHQVNNPGGTQRNLSIRHAKQAYKYAIESKNKRSALWPELILNIRINDSLDIRAKAASKGPKDSSLSFVKIKIDWDKLNGYKAKGEGAISRVDGNHRLYFAGGDINPKAFPAIDDVYSPFCIMDGISHEDERHIFKSINAEQRKLNVSHLLRIDEQTYTDDELRQQKKPLWVVKKLGDDRTSPFYGLIHKGGKKGKGEYYLIKEKSLYDGVEQLLKNFPNHENIKDQQRLLTAIINYFDAVSKVWPDEWKDPRQYKLMTNTGMQSLGIVGGKLMSLLTSTKQGLNKENYKRHLFELKQEISDYWRVKSEYMIGKSGRPGSQAIADDIYEKITVSDDLEIEV